jgi:hypothetical protein
MIAMLASAVYGMVIGALPGLTATMATALLVPVTFYLSPIAAMATIITSSAMAIFSGDIPGCADAHSRHAGLGRLYGRGLCADAQGPGGGSARRLAVVQRHRRHRRHLSR